MAPLRQEVRYHKVQEAESEDPEEVAVRIYRQSSPRVERSQYAEICLRVFAAILLLAVAAGLVLYEVKFGKVEPGAAFHRPPGSAERSWNASLWADISADYQHDGQGVESHGHEEPSSHQQEDLEEDDHEGHGSHQIEDPEEDGHEGHGSHQIEDPEEDGHEGHGSHQIEDPEEDGHEGHGSHQIEDTEEDGHEGHGSHQIEDTEEDGHEGHGSHQKEDPEEDGHGGHGSHHDESLEKQELLPAGHRHSAGTYHQAAIVTDSETCSRIGRELLASGGNVVDAGIAAAFCLAVVHPHSTSLGGIFSSIYYNGTSYTASALNAIPREASPTAHGIPHVLQGLRELHRQYGQKPWAQLTGAAIRLAKQGFLVDAALAAALEGKRHAVLSSVGLCSLFCESDNRVKGVGATVRNPKLGDILEQVATSMTDSSLPGSLIQSLAGDIPETDREAFMKALSKNNLRTEDPVTLHFQEMTLYSTPGPTAGTILTETLKETYRQMALLENSTTVHQDYQVLLNASMATYNKAGGSPRGSSGSPDTGRPAPVGSNVVVADERGAVFVMSLTINSTFGSGFISPSTGILLSDFACASQPSPPSSLTFWACPSVLFHAAEEDVMGLGATGGSSVPFSAAQVIFTHLVLQKELSVAVQGPPVDGIQGNAGGWYEYFGLAERRAESHGGEYPMAVVAAEVHAEHVHVAKSHGHCCFPDGL
ncbi:glutathione hydrolase 6 [Spea bombifrons]|uniref:glutathione hydrolase 6 n=1 Tax=Spea bombifrons TaxID=233779 RepID=UPI002349FD54|nr:glutathione hydrolase 6 [Spea bombifrons]